MLAELKKLRSENVLLENKVTKLEDLLKISQDISNQKDITIGLLNKMIDIADKEQKNNEQRITNLTTENKVLNDELAFVKKELQDVKKKGASRNKIIAIVSFLAGILVRGFSPIKF